MPLVRDEEAALVKAWDMYRIDDRLTHAADRGTPGQMPFGLVSGGRL
jgi:hypothetical protein